MLLLSIAIIPMIGMFDAGLRAAVLGSNYDKTRALANEKLEEVKALPYSSPDPAASGTANSVVEIYPPGTRDCTGTLEPGFTCRVETVRVRMSGTAIVPDANSKTMMQITVSVARSGGTPYSVTGLVTKGQK